MTEEVRTALVEQKAKYERAIEEVLGDDNPDNDHIARQYRFEISVIEERLAELA